MENTSGIYQIQSKRKPQRCYIGSAKNIPHRWNTHLKDLRGGYHTNNKLQHHYNKYGESDFIFSILLGCEIDYLIANEQFFIDSYKPWFNIAPKAGSMLGYRFSEEAKRKNGELHKGQKAWNKGLKQSKEQREKNSLNKMGNKNMLGKKHSEKTKKRWSEKRKGRIHSEGTRLRMIEAHVNRDPEKELARIDKIRKYQQNKGSDSEEVRLHKKEAWILRKAERAEQLLMQITQN
jgi:group I intron endonuclease